MTNEKPACLLLVQRQFPPDETECHTDHCTSATLAEHGIPAHTHTHTHTQTYTHTYTHTPVAVWCAIVEFNVPLDTV